jgi:hypothetical protein
MCRFERGHGRGKVTQHTLNRLIGFVFALAVLATILGVVVFSLSIFSRARRTTATRVFTQWKNGDFDYFTPPTTNASGFGEK